MGQTADKEFDPYHVWLGIPQSEQPPTLYRLVGVSDFERSPEVIRNAFLQRSSLLQALCAGKKRGLAESLLNEVTRAKLVLLDSEKKAEYDQSLRKENRTSSRKAQIVTTTVARRKRRSSPMRLLLQILIGAFVGIGGGLAILVWLGRLPSPFARNNVVPVSKTAINRQPVSTSRGSTHRQKQLPRQSSVQRPVAQQSDAEHEDLIAKPEAMKQSELPNDDLPQEPEPSPTEFTIHQLRSIQIYRPNGIALSFQSFLPDIGTLRSELQSAANSSGSILESTVVAFKDANGADFAFVSRRGNDLDGKLLVLNEQGGPAFIGNYKAGKRDGTVLLLDEKERVRFAARFRNRNVHGQAVLFRAGAPVVVVECLPKQFVATHRCNGTEIVQSYMPADTDPDFQSIATEIESFELSYLEAEKAVRKYLVELDEDERQYLAAVKNLEIRDRMAARRRNRAAANAAAINAAIDSVKHESYFSILPPLRANGPSR